MPAIIPEGSRVSARVFNDTTARVDVFVIAYENRNVNSSLLLKQARAPSYYSRGVTVDSGAVANTYGSWTEIQDITDEDVDSFHLSVSTGSSGNGTVRNWLFDVSIGSSGTEDDNIIATGILLWPSTWGHCNVSLNYIGSGNTRRLAYKCKTQE